MAPGESNVIFFIYKSKPRLLNEKLKTATVSTEKKVHKVEIRTFVIE